MEVLQINMRRDQAAKKMAARDAGKNIKKQVKQQDLAFRLKSDDNPFKVGTGIKKEKVSLIEEVSKEKQSSLFKLVKRDRTILAQ